MADVLIRAEMDDGGATGALNRLGNAFEHMQRRSATGTQGLRAVETGLRTLAAEAIGIHGPLGRVAEGLLAIGAGSTAVLAVAAGLAIASKAYKALTADATASAKAIKEQREELSKAAQANITSPAGARLGLLAVAQQDLQRGERELERLRALQRAGITRTQAPGGMGTEDIAARIADQAYQNLLTRIRMRQARGGPVPIAEVSVEGDAEIPFWPDKGKLDMLAIRKAAMGMGPSLTVPPFGVTGLGQTARDSMAGGSAKLGEDARQVLEGLRTPMESLQQQQVMLTSAFEVGEISQEQYEQGIRRIGEEMEKTTRKSSLLAVSIVGAVSGAIQAIAAGGGPGAVVSGIGGTLMSLSVAHPALALPAAIISGIGGLISSLFSSSKPAVVIVDGYSSTAITQQQQLMQALSGFLGLSISVLSAGTAGPSETAYALSRAARLDGGMRLPPGSR